MDKETPGLMDRAAVPRCDMTRCLLATAGLVGLQPAKAGQSSVNSKRQVTDILRAAALLLEWGLMGEQIMDVAELPAAARDGMHERVIAAIDRIIEAALEARPTTWEGS